MSSIMDWLPPFHFLDCLTWASYQCFILFNVILFKYDIFIRKNQYIKMILRFSFFSSSLRLSNMIHVFDADFFFNHTGMSKIDVTFIELFIIDWYSLNFTLIRSLILGVICLKTIKSCIII